MRIFFLKRANFSKLGILIRKFKWPQRPGWSYLGFTWIKVTTTSQECAWQASCRLPCFNNLSLLPKRGIKKKLRAWKEWKRLDQLRLWLYYLTGSTSKLFCLDRCFWCIPNPIPSSSSKSTLITMTRQVLRNTGPESLQDQHPWTNFR